MCDDSERTKYTCLATPVTAASTSNHLPSGGNLGFGPTVIGPSTQPVLGGQGVLIFFKFGIEMCCSDFFMVFYIYKWVLGLKMRFQVIQLPQFAFLGFLRPIIGKKNVGMKIGFMYLKRSVFDSRFQRKKTKLNRITQCREICQKLSKFGSLVWFAPKPYNFDSFWHISLHWVIRFNFVFLR